MKTPDKHTGWLLAAIAGLSFALLIGTNGCSSIYARDPDPLPGPGWKLCWDQDPKKLDKVIQDDYLDYISKLPGGQKNFARYLNDFEDGTGRHAVKIQITLEGKWVEHLLIYDKENKRIKVFKYSGGRYMS